ncbi:hypothetical protein Hanom_Chr04g00290721 [Helianthus anomalus]
MDGVNEPDENGKISNLLDPDAKKQTFGRKSQNWPNHRDEMAFYSINMHKSHKILHLKLLELLIIFVENQDDEGKLFYLAINLCMFFSCHSKNSASLIRPYLMTSASPDANSLSGNVFNVSVSMSTHCGW